MENGDRTLGCPVLSGIIQWGQTPGGSGHTRAPQGWLIRLGSGKFGSSLLKCSWEFLPWGSEMGWFAKLFRWLVDGYSPFPLIWVICTWLMSIFGTFFFFFFYKFPATVNQFQHNPNLHCMVSLKERHARHNDRTFLMHLWIVRFTNAPSSNNMQKIQIFKNDETLFLWPILVSSNLESNQSRFSRIIKQGMLCTS